MNAEQTQELAAALRGRKKRAMQGAIRKGRRGAIFAPQGHAARMPMFFEEMEKSTKADHQQALFSPFCLMHLFSACLASAQTQPARPASQPQTKPASHMATSERR